MKVKSCLIFLLLLLLLSSPLQAAFQEASTIIVSFCGNNTIEGAEVCDGTDLAGNTCLDFGYIGGTLYCTDICDGYILTSCTSGGGGGGGYVPPPPTETGVIFSARAYPKSTITLLKDAQIAATTIADTNANFRISLIDISAGNYIFSIYSEDHQGYRSSLLTFPTSLTAGITTTIGGIFIAPTIDVDKSEVKRGDNIAIFGQSAPQADILISVASEEEFFARTISDKDGIYLHNFDTSILEYGSHHTRSKASIGNLAISGFSPSIGFKVGNVNVPKEGKSEFLKGDLNNDGKVNLVDFSIAAYWYKRTLSSAMEETECERLNCDYLINLVDFSIMAYYWTG